MREDLDEETMVDIGMRQEASQYHTNGGADGIGSGDAVAVLSKKSLPHPGGEGECWFVLWHSHLHNRLLDELVTIQTSLDKRLQHVLPRLGPWAEAAVDDICGDPIGDSATNETYLVVLKNSTHPMILPNPETSASLGSSSLSGHFCKSPITHGVHASVTA